MIKETITYKDLDGNDLTEDFYFNFSKAEIAEMSMENGGMQKYLEDIIKSDNKLEILKNFKLIVNSSVGRRSEDGKRFIKNDQIRDEFAQSNAYSELFMKLLTDAEAATKFIKGVLPADLSANIDVAEPKKEDVSLRQDYSIQDLVAMPDEQFAAVCGSNPREMTKSQLVAAMQRITK